MLRLITKHGTSSQPNRTKFAAILIRWALAARRTLELPIGMRRYVSEL